MVLSGDRKALPAETVSKRNVSGDLPMVARIQSILLPPHRVRIAKLIRFTCATRQSEQESCPGIECICRRDCGAGSWLSANVGGCIGSIARLQCRSSAVKLEGAALRLKCCALWLKMVDLRFQEVTTETERMRAFKPG